MKRYNNTIVDITEQEKDRLQSMFLCFKDYYIKGEELKNLGYITMLSASELMHQVSRNSEMDYSQIIEYAQNLKKCLIANENLKTQLDNFEKYIRNIKNEIPKVGNKEPINTPSFNKEIRL